MQKIIYVSNVSVIGGANNALFRLMEKIKNKYDISLILPKKDSAFKMFNGLEIPIYFESKMGILGHSTGLKYEWYRTPQLIRDIIKIPFSINAFIKLFTRLKPDIVHLNSSVLAGPALAAKLLKIKIVWHIREHLIEDFRGRLFVSIIGIIADRILAINKSTARVFRKSKVDVLYDVVDLDRFDKDIKSRKLKDLVKYSNNELLVGFFGGINRIKGSLDFLEAARYLIENDNKNKYKFIIVGKINQINNPLSVLNYNRCLLKKYLLKVDNIVSNYKDSIFILGERDDIPELMSEMDIIVVAHKDPHSALPSIEAGAMNKPVVAYDWDEISEIVKNNISGFTIRKHTPENLSKKIRLLAENNDLRKLFGKNGYKIIKDNYSFHAIREKINKIYKVLD